MRNTFLILAACTGLLAPQAVQAAPSSDIVVGWATNLPAEAPKGVKLCEWPVKQNGTCATTAYPVRGVVTGYYEDGSAVIVIDGEEWTGRQTDLDVIQKTGARLKLVRWIMGSRAR